MHRKAFTLLELLIVIAILAVLATVAVLVINPLEYIKQSRDAKRIGDIEVLNKALGLAGFEGVSLGGASTTVFVSLVDNVSSTCGTLGLPALPSGYQYHCVTTATDLRKVDGNGWIPVNFTALPGKAPVASLPDDPSASVANGFYYFYITNGTDRYELGSVMESAKYKIGGSDDKVSTDGGTDPYRYEVGNNLALYKQEILANANFSTGNLNGWITSAGGVNGIVTTESHYGQKSAIIQNSNSYCNNYYYQDIPVIPNTVYSMGAWIKTVNEVGNTSIGIADTSWGEWIKSSLVTGTKDWTYVSVQKNSGALTTMRFLMTVGWCGGIAPGNGPSGTTYFSTPSVVAGTNLLNK